jgi:2-polyprenyl-3-methyl-5-hydroxy-6-metoxy-1,4-benzoquinol methylase
MATLHGRVYGQFSHLINQALMSTESSDYQFYDSQASHMHRLFMPHVMDLAGEIRPGMRVLDVGCGNGYTCGQFLAKGCEVTGIDLSLSGIEIARRSHPGARFEVMGADNHILENLGVEAFDLIVSTEVVEHLYAPRPYVNGVFSALKSGGRFICTTPYHGYLKNLAIALTDGWDKHWDPLWDGGHIKLWSKATIWRLLSEAGFENMQFRGAGRLPWLWMTMIISVGKPKQ